MNLNVYISRCGYQYVGITNSTLTAHFSSVRSSMFTISQWLYRYVEININIIGDYTGYRFQKTNLCRIPIQIKDQNYGILYFSRILNYCMSVSFDACFYIIQGKWYDVNLWFIQFTEGTVLWYSLGGGKHSFLWEWMKQLVFHFPQPCPKNQMFYLKWAHNSTV